uniref:Uncharacterized protein n=1 Tax=Timema monikensis TaxID=170555 RepID=A0A7R9E9L6_9NEOP|nr:unnamed protein product [Timema monikensis]
MLIPVSYSETPDKTLQDMVYKLVPGLFHSEMKRRRDFYIKQHPDQDYDITSKTYKNETDAFVHVDTGERETWLIIPVTNLHRFLSRYVLVALTTPAQRGVAAEQYFFSPEDSVSLSLEYLDTVRAPQYERHSYKAATPTSNQLREGWQHASSDLNKNDHSPDYYATRGAPTFPSDRASNEFGKLRVCSGNVPRHSPLQPNPRPNYIQTASPADRPSAN